MFELTVKYHDVTLTCEVDNLMFWKRAVSETIKNDVEYSGLTLGEKVTGIVHIENSICYISSVLFTFTRGPLHQNLDIEVC